MCIYITIDGQIQEHHDINYWNIQELKCFNQCINGVKLIILMY